MAEKLTFVTLCDRCGNEAKNFAAASARSKKTWPIPVGWINIHNGSNKLDICPDCQTSFNAWLDQPKNVAAENQDAAVNGVDPNPTIINRLPAGFGKVLDASVTKAPDELSV